MNTDKKFTHKDLVNIGYRWMLKNCSCGVVFKELESASSNEIPDVIGFGAWGHSVVIEVKVSRSDFLNDKRKSFRTNTDEGMGKQRFYLCPKGMITKEELPAGWGLVYVYEDGKARMAHCPYRGNIGERNDGFKKNEVAESGIMYSALRRLFIKGFVKYIYDKDYNRSSDVNDLIKLNELPSPTPFDRGDCEKKLLLIFRDDVHPHRIKQLVDYIETLINKK